MIYKADQIRFAEAQKNFKKTLSLMTWECPLGGWKCAPYLSEKASDGSNTLIRIDEDTTYSGKQSLLLATEEGKISPHLYISKWLPTTMLSEGDWTFSAWVKADPYQGETLPIALLLNVHADEAWRSLGQAETFAVGREWQKISIAAPVPSCGGHPWVALGFQEHNKPGTGRIWVNDARLQRSDEGYQAIANARAERIKDFPAGAKAFFKWMPLSDGVLLRTLCFGSSAQFMGEYNER